MSSPVTIDDIYELFRISQQEADRRAAEADRRMQKLEQGLFVIKTSGETVEIVNDEKFQALSW